MRQCRRIKLCVGYARGERGVPAVAGSLTVDWSDDAFADLNRFAAFLQEHSSTRASGAKRRAEILSHVAFDLSRSKPRR